jgi:hypothetical protein
MGDTDVTTPAGSAGSQGTDPLARLAEAVNAVAELNYPGGEFESLIDELDAAFHQHQSRHQ